LREKGQTAGFFSSTSTPRWTPAAVPGGVAVDLSILRAVPYVVARVMGRWLVTFSVAGLRLTTGNFNIVIDGDRKSAKYALRDGDRNTVGNLLFNYCGEMECGVVRTADFEFKSLVKCRDFGMAFSQRSLVVNVVVVEMGQRRRLGQA
jgi:hypothetical protein